MAVAIRGEGRPVEVSIGSRSNGVGFLLAIDDLSRAARLWSTWCRSVGRTPTDLAIANPWLVRVDLVTAGARSFTLYGEASGTDEAWQAIYDAPLWGTKWRVTPGGATERVTYGDLRRTRAPEVLMKVVGAAASLGLPPLRDNRVREAFANAIELGWPQGISYAPASARLKLDVAASSVRRVADVVAAACASEDAVRIRRFARMVGGAFGYFSLAVDRDGTLDWRVYSSPLHAVDPDRVIAAVDPA